MLDLPRRRIFILTLFLSIREPHFFVPYFRFLFAYKVEWNGHCCTLTALWLDRV